MIQPTPPPSDRKARPPRDPGAEPRTRWRTVFVDSQVLAAVTPAASRDAHLLDEDESAETTPPLQVITRLSDEVQSVRKNVRDAAAAVLAWVAAVVGHEGKTDLDDVLDRCLRPGPDIERVNYAAMATEIFRVTGIELTPKRVQTAVSHLRAAHDQKAVARRTADEAETPSLSLRERLDTLGREVREQFAAHAG